MPGKRQIVRHTSDAQSAAWQALVDGLWSDPARKSQFSELLAALWRDYQSEPEYEALRRGLSDAMKRKG